MKDVFVVAALMFSAALAVFPQNPNSPKHENALGEDNVQVEVVVLGPGVNMLKDPVAQLVRKQNAGWRYIH